MKVMTFFSFILISGISAKVAIIGKGLSAAICSYYLHKIIPDVEIDIYDHKSNYQSFVREFYHSSNLYMIKIIEENKFLTFINFYRPLVKDGDEIHFHDVKQLEEIDPTGYSKFQKFVQRQLQIFEQIYKFQDDGNTFKTVRELLNKLDPNFLKYYTEETICSLLNKVMGPEESPAITKFVKTTLVRHCFADMNSHALAGLEMLIFSDLTGNVKQLSTDEQRIITKLFNKKDNFIKMDISKIIYSKEDDINYVIPTDNRPIKYDFVILATVTAGKIKFDCFKEQIKVFEYREGHCTYLTGDLVETMKNPPSKSSLIINTDKNHTFYKYPEKKDNYAINKPLVEALKSEILEYLNPYRIQVVGTFKACPDYSKDKLVRNAKFELGEKLYNAHALDSIGMSTGELLAICAKNIALLIREKFPKNNGDSTTHELPNGPKLSKKGSKPEKIIGGDSTSHVLPNGPNLSKKNPKSKKANRRKKSTKKV